MQKLSTNKKMHFKVIQNIGIMLGLFSLFSCATTRQTQEQYVDYSDISAVKYQIESAKKLLDDGNALGALIRAEILDNNTQNISEVIELKKKSINKVKESFSKNISNEKWLEALKDFRSLTSLKHRPKNWTETKILEKQNSLWKKQGNSPFLSNKEDDITDKRKNIYPNNFEEMLRGTLTVWVDKGTRIERGVGFSDIVIGSGFFIDKQGYFITNYHVIQSEVDKKYNGYSRVYIKSPNNPNIKIKATVVGWDPLFDIALLKTELHPEIIFKLGSSKKLKVGSKIFAIGSPAGLEKTLTAGIVSTKYRRLFSLVDVMQIDAPINHGNSGGPIVDETGVVQGVVFAGLDRNEGLNFAIPVELLQSILPQLYIGGKVEHSWLGGYGRKKILPEKNIQGIEASYIMPTSPLAVSQIKESSIITEFNGVKVTTTEELQAEILSILPDTIVKIKGYEKVNNKYMHKEWSILCNKRPLLPGEEIIKKDSSMRTMLPIFGLYLKPTGKRKTFRVSKIEPGSFADEAGFSVNDTIQINGKNKIGDNNEIIQVHIYAKKVKAGYIDSFMIISQYLDNSNFF